MANLAAINPPGAATAKEMTIAEMLQQAHNGVRCLQESMISLGCNAGVLDIPKMNTADIPTPSQMRDVAQDLIKLVESCHEVMGKLNRIA